MIAIPQPAHAVRIRRATAADAVVAGPICYDAFTSLNSHHNMPQDWPGPDVATEILSFMFSDPRFYAVVAEIDEVVGSNVIDERDEIAGIGPITVRPDVQERDLGRLLMRAVMDRAVEKNFVGVRLVQASFNTRSLSLYTKLGFEIREPLATMRGTPLKKQSPECTIRKATAADLSSCNDLCFRVHGHRRANEVADALRLGTLSVCERRDAITAYATNFAFFGHAVALSNRDLLSLIAAAEEVHPTGFLVPIRNTEIFQACLAMGFRVAHCMNLMTIGLYNEPKGAYLPSISY